MKTAANMLHVGARRRRMRGGRPVEGRPETPLDGLLDDVRDLRLTLASDLSAAAGAVDMGADDVAGDIVEADREEIARFVHRADLRLSGLAPAEVPSQRAGGWRRRAIAALPAVPLVGAMALSAAAATGVLPVPGATDHPAVTPQSRPAVTTPVTSAFAQFAHLVDHDPSATQLLAAAAKLHRQLAVMLAAGAHDPSQVAEVARLLQMEQSLLLRHEPPGTPIVLAAAHRLAAQLVATAAATATTLPTPTATSTRHHADTARLSPRPSSTATSTSAPTPNTQSPSASPKPVSTPTPTPTPTTTAAYNPFANFPN